MSDTRELDEKILFLPGVAEPFNRGGRASGKQTYHTDLEVLVTLRGSMNCHAAKRGVCGTKLSTALSVSRLCEIENTIS